MLKFYISHLFSHLWSSFKLGEAMKFFLLILAMFITQNLWAWGDMGHSIVGEIAERNLTKKAKAFVQSILGVEPLAVAATWPDRVRDDNRFKAFSEYHFWEDDSGLSYADIPMSKRSDRDAHTIVSQAYRILLGSKLNKNQKMIYLRYFIHILGDVHQPMHLGNPSDLGGNLCSVRFKDMKDPVKLHAVWDSMIIEKIPRKDGKKGSMYYPELTELILNDISAPNEITGTPVEWYDETRKLLSVAYPDKQPTAPEDRAYCKRHDPETDKIVNGKYDESKIPTLDDEYIAAAIPVIKKQLLLGGLRLAHLLNKIGEDSNSYGAMDEKKLLDGVLITNDRTNRTPQSKSKK